MSHAKEPKTHVGKAALWQQRIEDWEASGLSQVVYCQRNGLKHATFAYWRKRFPTDRSSAQRLRLVAIDTARAPAPSSTVAKPDPIFTVQVGGLRVEVQQGYDPSLLIQLVRTLQEV